MNQSEVHPFLVTRGRIIFEERKHDFEVMRIQTFHLLTPHLKENSTVRKPSDLIKFAWDKLPTIQLNLEEYTEEAFQQAERRYGLKKG